MNKNLLGFFDLQLFADGDGGGDSAGGNPPANNPAPSGNEPQNNNNPTPPANNNAPTNTPPANNTILGGDPPANNQQQNNQSNQQNTTPENYDFAAIIPEGMQADEQATQEFSAIAKKCGLSQEQASEIAKYGIGFSQRAVEQINQGYSQMVTDWGKQTQQELGNDYQSVVSNAGKGIEALEKQIPGLRNALNETGVGNRVELVKAFSLLGQLVSEDSFRGFNGVVPQRDNIYKNTDFNNYR